jgi:hypothetical protein
VLKIRHRSHLLHVLLSSYRLLFSKAEVYLCVTTPNHCVIVSLTASLALYKSLEPLNKLKVILILALGQLHYLHIGYKYIQFLGYADPVENVLKDLQVLNELVLGPSLPV